MGVEIERKFLVDHDKWRQVHKPEGSRFRQGYIVNTDQHTIRIRVTDKESFITLKGDASGISHKEFEYAIPARDAVEILESFAATEVEKIRYCLYFDGKLWEVDEYGGDNEGLITAEIELTREDEEFSRPEWLGMEVSYDGRYYNSSLSVHPYKKWDS